MKIPSILACFLFAVASCAAGVPATTAFSTAGRVEFSQAGHLTIGNDIFGITAPDHSRQIENTDVGMPVQLYAMGHRASWKGSYRRSLRRASWTT